jgi:hypothetical protein
MKNTKNNSVAARTARVIKSLKVENRKSDLAVYKRLSKQYGPKVSQKPRSAAAPKQTTLSVCGQKYLLAVSDPFNPLCRDACIPSSFGTPSRKTTTLLRFQSVTQANGINTCAISPSTANNDTFATVTDGTGTITAVAVGGSGLTAVSNTLGPYSVSDLTPQVIATGSYGDPPVKGKIVAIGVRFKYSSAPLNRAGVYTCAMTPDHSHVTNKTAAQLGAFDYAQVNPIDDRWHEFATSCVNPQEADYYQVDQGATSSSSITEALYRYNSSQIASGVTTGCPIFGFITTGAPVSSIFQWEVIIHSEYANGTTSIITSDTHSDPAAFSHIASALGRATKYVAANIGVTLKEAVPKMLFQILRENTPTYRYAEQRDRMGRLSLTEL